MNIEHSAYKTLLPLWTKVRDVVAGEEVVKASGTKYLPMLTSQIESADARAREEYENYLLRAGFYGAAGRTVMGLVGAVLRKDPTMEGVPEQFEKQIDDNIGIDYESVSSVVAAQLRDAVSVGRYALLVDKGEDPDESAYVVKYRAEDVVFWAKDMVRGRVTPVTIVLRQSYEERKEGDELGTETEEKTEYLALRLGMVADHIDRLEGVEGVEGFAGAPTDEVVYWQEYYRLEEAGGKTKRTLNRVKVPTKNGGRFWREIPCDIVNAIGGIRVDTEEPPMLPLANCVLAHYRNSADLEWGRHMTAIPQPWANGFDLEEGQSLVVGCGYAWVTPSPQASVNYLEFSGAGLNHLAEGLKEKEKQMAVLGARMLEEQPNQAEAMGTVRLRQSGDRSVLGTIAHHVSEATTRAIQRWLAWESSAFDSDEQMEAVSYELSTDFEQSKMDPAELAALTQALQEGTISWETFSYNLRRGEMLPPGVTDDEERERIQQGAPGRSRKDELAQLQADVREGRISKQTYLEQAQALGMLPGVDVVGEADRIYEEKVVAAELQMQSFMQAGNNLGMPGAAPPTAGDGGAFGAEPPAPPMPEPEEPETEDDEEEEETVPPSDDEDEDEEEEA